MRTAESERDSLARRLGVRYDEIERLRIELRAVRFVCGERERELLELKGSCSKQGCRLHYAHAGPCDLIPVTQPQAIPIAPRRQAPSDGQGAQ